MKIYYLTTCNWYKNKELGFLLEYDENFVNIKIVKFKNGNSMLKNKINIKYEFDTLILYLQATIENILSYNL